MNLRVALPLSLLTWAAIYVLPLNSYANLHTTDSSKPSIEINMQALNALYNVEPNQHASGQHPLAIKKAKDTPVPLLNQKQEPSILVETTSAEIHTPYFEKPSKATPYQENTKKNADEGTLKVKKAWNKVKSFLPIKHKTQTDPVNKDQELASNNSILPASTETNTPKMAASNSLQAENTSSHAKASNDIQQMPWKFGANEEIPYFLFEESYKTSPKKKLTAPKQNKVKKRNKNAKHYQINGSKKITKPSTSRKLYTEKKPKNNDKAPLQKTIKIHKTQKPVTQAKKAVQTTPPPSDIKKAIITPKANQNGSNNSVQKKSSHNLTNKQEQTLQPKKKEKDTSKQTSTPQVTFTKTEQKTKATEPKLTSTEAQVPPSHLATPVVKAPELTPAQALKANALPSPTDTLNPAHAGTEKTSSSFWNKVTSFWSFTGQDTEKPLPNSLTNNEKVSITEDHEPIAHLPWNGDTISHLPVPKVKIASNSPPAFVQSMIDGDQLELKDPAIIEHVIQKTPKKPVVSQPETSIELSKPVKSGNANKPKEQKNTVSMPAKPASSSKNETKVTPTSSNKSFAIASKPTAIKKPFEVVTSKVLMRIPFDTAQTDIPNTSMDKLESLIQELSDSGQRITIISYAKDVNGKPTSSRRISLQRAISVRKYLIDHGFNSMHINVQAMGNNVASASDGNTDRIDIMLADNAKS